MLKKRCQITPATYLVLLKGNQVLLLRRFNTGYEDGNYSLPAGHVETGETLTQCIVRESKEEISIELNSKNLEAVHFMHRNLKDYEYLDIFFMTEKWSGEIINKETDKCDDLSWFDLNNLPENTIPYIKAALNKIKNCIYYSEFNWEK
jgi:8-oxo-dGTP diphosphatase